MSALESVWEQPGDSKPERIWSTWGMPWEPFKIAVSAFYALCAAKAVSAAATYFEKTYGTSPTTVTEVWNKMTGDHWATMFGLFAYLMWLSLNYFYNLLYFLQIPDQHAWDRIFGFVNLILTLSLFYLLASAIGPPTQLQMMLIFVIVLINLQMPIWLLRASNRDHLPPPLTDNQRWWWVAKSVILLAVISYMLHHYQNAVPEGAAALFAVGLAAVMVVAVPIETHLHLRPKFTTQRQEDFGAILDARLPLHFARFQQELSNVDCKCIPENGGRDQNGN